MQEVHAGRDRAVSLASIGLRLSDFFERWFPDAFALAEAQEREGGQVGPDGDRPRQPGEWLEYSPLLSVLASLMGIAYLIREIGAGGWAVALDLNH
jgi:short subunit fatty acids transporter